MADFVVTAANVDSPTSGTAKTLIAGEAITAGMAIYKKAADGKAWKALNATDAEAAAVGIAVCDAAAGQTVSYFSTGDISFGAIFGAKGAIACVSNTAGALAPLADISAAGERLFILGIATSTSVLRVGPIAQSTGITY